MAIPPHDILSAQESTEDPNIQNCDMSSPVNKTFIIEERIMSQPDQIDDSTPPLHTESTLYYTPTSPSSSSDGKPAYNGPSTVYVVMMRVTKETSARPMPQAAFFDHNKALSLSTRILMQWCNAHYEDYIWKGPESLRSGLMERYAAYDTQSGQQLAVADVIKVSIFDAKETEGVVKGDDGEEIEEEEVEEKHKEQFGEGPHEEYFEEKEDEDQGDAETVTTDSSQTHDQETDLDMFHGTPAESITTESAQADHQQVDLDERREAPTEPLYTGYSMQAAVEYAMDLVTKRAAHEERYGVAKDSHRGAWREDFEMRVFGGPTE
ncbi:hypothetical protein E4T44_04536 [Aureobasidium sp. EXF-8845]|nr:hypothetical protein E4T44_04536 [Aureobasidium sp. EXF-8845]KAI4850621.1 hypothetical protein E4T45_05422 [Aureobasidium sp. EXF-8846]